MALSFFDAAAFTGLAGLTASGMFETTMAEKAQMEQLQLQEKQKNLQLTQKKLSVYDNTKKVLDRQVAQASTRGIGMDSPSFNAIQRNTTNISSKELQNVNTEQGMSDYMFNAERENVKRTTHAKLFGQGMQAGVSFAQLTSGI